MSDVLRSTTFQLEFKGEDGVAGIKRFTKAVSDADATVDALSETLGENVSVTYKTVQSSQELTAEARALVNQMERTNKVAKDLTAQYQHQSNMIGKTADEQEQLNAVYKLGAHATEAQKQEVIELVQSYQSLRNASTGTQGSFRDLRGVSQQLGWQLQDVAVQAQLGTSAFIIFSQQGSQLAAAFGPTGALVGAFIAVAGALAGPLMQALKGTGEEIDNLVEKVDTLGKATRQMEAKRLTGVLEEDREELDKLSKRIDYINKNPLNTEKGVAGQQKALIELTAEQEALNATIAENQKKLDLINRSYNENTKAVDDAAKAAAELKTQYNIEIDQLGKTDRQIEIDTALRKLGTDAKDEDKKAVTQLINTLYNEKDAQEAAEAAVKSKTAADKEAASTAERVTKQKIAAFDTLYKSLVKQTETVEQAYTRQKAVIDDYIATQGENEETAKAMVALDQWRTEELQKETNKIVKEYEKRENARRKIEKELPDVRSTGIFGQLAQETSKFEANIKILEKQVDAVHYEMMRKNSALQRDMEDGLISQAKYEADSAKVNEEGLKELNRINLLKEGEQDRHSKAMNDLQIALYEAQLQGVADAAMIMSSTVDMMSMGKDEVKAMTAEMNAAQKAMFVVNQAIAAANAMISGIALGSKLAELFPLAAPAMITLGTSLGAAQAGAIMGTTIVGAFDEGGTIPAGKNGIVSEYGDELVNGVLVKGPARVTSREDTAAMMAGGGSSVAITIENRIDGATYRTEQVDETTVRIIAEKVFHDNIDSGVAGTLGNRNSKATKQMKKSFNVRSSY